MKRAAVLGASGYTGRELQRLLARHPALELHVFASAREGASADVPDLESEPEIEALDWKRVEECDGVFLCTPHGTSAPLAQRCLELGKHVVDLSADFRLPDPALYRAHYAHEHPAPQLLPQAVYGLTELARERLHGARLVANPGCYPTSILLALRPLLEAGLVAPQETIVCDSKSGVSGAGKTPSARTHFGNSHENFLAYAIGNHRHQPEIRLHAGTEKLVFVPHLLPVFRGILSTIYLAPAPGVKAQTLRDCLRERYAGERFVRVFERGLPELRGVQNTNECHVAVGECGDRMVLVSVIDNLLKGASGQALQNMNLALGLEEAAGLA
ncbi:MAG: N-acetyl-gamma-glutamyl-phosphate reductase [Planctomycetes bacterium]|nr:N-acetyl-gamma-glutamyl-phosphate reductase [Planctomycetota bacterium]